MYMKGRWSEDRTSWSGSDHTPCLKTPLSNSSALSMVSRCPLWNGEWVFPPRCLSTSPAVRPLSFFLGTKTMWSWMFPLEGTWLKLQVESILLKSWGTVSDVEVISLCQMLRLLFSLSFPLKIFVNPRVRTEILKTLSTVKLHRRNVANHVI